MHGLQFTRDHAWLPPHASDYLDGDLAPEDRARTERHADACPECRELLRSLGHVVAALGTLRSERGDVVAVELFASIRTRLGQPSDDL
jgi:anti-sigma factor RsiW